VAGGPVSRGTGVQMPSHAPGIATRGYCYADGASAGLYNVGHTTLPACSPQATETARGAPAECTRAPIALQTNHGRQGGPVDRRQTGRLIREGRSHQLDGAVRACARPLRIRAGRRRNSKSSFIGRGHSCCPRGITAMLVKDAGGARRRGEVSCCETTRAEQGACPTFHLAMGFGAPARWICGSESSAVEHEAAWHSN